MKVNPAPVQAPPLPTVPPGATSLDVGYTAPETRDEVIGHIPSDNFSAMMFDSGHCDDPVVRPQPVLNADGTPKWVSTTRVLDLKPYSPWKKGAIGAGIGAAVGGVAGLALGHFVADSLVGGLAVGGPLGALIGGGIAAARVLNDTVEPGWALRPVVRHELDSYSHSAIPQTMTIQTGKDTSMTVTTGYHNYYSPNVSEHTVGGFHFWEPVARHSADQ